MSVTLGLDIGSNSVGSAWIDTEQQIIQPGVSVFPAGVEDDDKKRGAPKNQKRRLARSQRRGIRRRATRKRELRLLLTEKGLLPADSEELAAIFSPSNRDEADRWNPWVLRRKALTHPVSPYEFGRILIHMNQRRGAVGIQVAIEDEDKKGKSEEAKEATKVKNAIGDLHAAMQDRQAETVGQFIADLMDERRNPIPSKDGKYYHDPVRNRLDSFEFHADRETIRHEFSTLWERQRSFDGPLAKLLTDALKLEFDNPAESAIRRHQGAIFGQRRTYWNTGTLGRCDLEPTDHRCSIADMYAQEFRVQETVNNLRIRARGEAYRPLEPKERELVIEALRKQKTASPTTIRIALGINKKQDKEFYTLNIEQADADRSVNTDWFYRTIVHDVFTEEAWLGMTEKQRDSVNRGILRFDPDKKEHVERLRRSAMKWWDLSPDAADKLIEACKKRPKIEKRLNLSRCAIRNLMPYMRKGLTVTEARREFAENPDNDATPLQRVRYAFNITDALRTLLAKLVGGESAKELLSYRTMTKADRHFMEKHPNQLPPAPMLANPVVRKAIHEVRRHVIAHMRRFGRKPDRIVIELTREAKQTAMVRNRILARNRTREKARKEIIEDFRLEGKSRNQQRAAVDRVFLCRQQCGACAYSGKPITERMAAEGTDLEIDHIVPMSRSQENGMDNKVLCFRETNRLKGNQTPKEWLSTGEFEQLEARLSHFEKPKPKKGDVFSKGAYVRKWENLHRDPEPLDKFANSQLTDTAYAATQVGDYLRDALYGDEDGSKRRIFFTKGKYTAMLRKDWQLFQSLPSPETDDKDEQRRRQEQEALGEKNRGDHRHHAIDAVVIALTGPEIIKDIARLAAEGEQYRERTGHWPRRDPLPPPKPWKSVKQFRRHVLSTLFGRFDSADEDGRKTDGVAEGGTALIVSHRPVKRKITGAFHEETAYGTVRGSKTLFTNRIRAEVLTPNHLRPPAPETDAQVIERLAAGFEDEGLSKRAACKKARTELEAKRFKHLMVDPPPGKSGIVRDRGLRMGIRACLKSHGLNPDNFTKKEIKEFVRPGEQGKLRMASGVPIKRVVLLRTHMAPVVIPRKCWDPAIGRYVRDPDPRTRRVYIGGNNHHVEIREKAKNGKWIGRLATTFEAAKRARADKKPAVNRLDESEDRFIMSLAEGETIKLRSPKMKHTSPAEVDCFVVVKLDRSVSKTGNERVAIVLKHHADARPASGKDPATGEKFPPAKLRETVSLSPGQLQRLCLQEDAPPYKIQASPLGEIRPLPND